MTTTKIVEHKVLCYDYHMELLNEVKVLEKDGCRIIAGYFVKPNHFLWMTREVK